MEGSTCDVPMMNRVFRVKVKVRVRVRIRVRWLECQVGRDAINERRDGTKADSFVTLTLTLTQTLTPSVTLNLIRISNERFKKSLVCGLGCN